MAKITPDLNIGDMYGSWEIIEERPRTEGKYYLCECKCGTIKEISKSNLSLGKSKSCNKGECKSKSIIHNMSNTKLYKVWCNIKDRLKNPDGNNSCYVGIVLDPNWENFKTFSEWALANGYQEGLTIDRINSSLGYNPDNCSWTDKVVQSQNRRKHSNKELDLPKGVYKWKPRNGEIKYKGTGKAPYYWIVIYKGNRHQCSGFTTPEEAYQDRCQFIKQNYDGLVYYD